MQMTMATGTIGHTFGVRVQRVQKGRFLRLTGPKAGGFLSLTGLWPEGGGGGFAADYKKGARLRRGLCRRVASLRSGGDSPHGLRGVVAPFGAQRTHFEGALATRKM